ncbi:hypothetical protein C8J57DRAFT_1547194 [Mycena rebaudengoi]|nr:hypothetical protein C8J57DRAFT_1547194 [Mycena rebaudengoi]
MDPFKIFRGPALLSIYVSIIRGPKGAKGLFQGESKLPSAPVIERTRHIQRTTLGAIANSAVLATRHIQRTTLGAIANSAVLAIWLFSADTQLVADGDETKIDYQYLWMTFMRQICEGLREDAMSVPFLLAPSPYWGSILKSNSNGTYFGLSIENVNRNEMGFVDFEKMIGLDGIALINVVSNTQEALITGRKSLQSRITHNDGGSWKPLTPPLIDSQGNKYECSSTKCALHVHGYTERRDPRATYSSSSIVGLIMAVGNVGETLAPYEQCDTFLSRDAGFTWEEVHKDAHLWKFGDSGSILVMANDEEPTDHVLFSTDEGMNWREYKFSEEKLRVLSILTVPMDTSRRFILIARAAHAITDIAVHLDFTALTWKQCVLSIDNPGHDDFELWSPSEEHQEQCLFGRQTLYHRRVRDRNCVVGDQPKATERIEKNCICTPADFECEFNHYKEDGKCVLYPGAQPLANENTCGNGADFWYERTAYRKISYSSCAAGERLDRGPRHECPDFSGHSEFFWFMVIVFPIAFVSIVGYWYYNRSGLARGAIHLP